MRIETKITAELDIIVGFHYLRLHIGSVEKR
jgi:hypothetical protein